MPIPKEVIDYWENFLAEFEEIYPVFHARGYTKGVALQAYLVDQLDSSLMQFIARTTPDEEKS